MVMDTCPKAALAEASRLWTSEARFNSVQTIPDPKSNLEAALFAILLLLTAKK